MNMLTNWSLRHPKVRQWLWFVGLWLMGFVTMFSVAYVIKLLIHWCR